MALRILNAGVQPLGQFDVVDGELTALKGGEVVTLVKKTLSGGDKAAADVFDGYVRDAGAVGRAAVSAAGVGASTRPLFLADEGTVGYGTLFGQVVGGTAGQVATGGAVLGPHTATGSGKVTCWDKPGLYGVTLDAVDASTVIPTSNSITVGTPLYATVGSGLLSTSNSSSAQRVGTFVEFMTNGSLVTTPNQLVAAMNSPSGPVPSAIGPSFYMAVFHFEP